ncbi:MAG: protein kinase [Planctomycetota bacterium]
MLEGSALGPYQVTSELARGGMGIVYHAFDPSTGEEVALKVLTSQRAGQRFEREVDALARIQHPNVVPVLHCGIYLEHPWVAMAFVPGATLQERLDQRGPVTPGLAVAWIAKLARAVEAVHDAGVVHRDIKPANVILTPTGEPVLTDFGLALDASSQERLSMDGATLGSPGYFSPEQAVGDLARIDQRSDVYGLGATLYALLTGRPPIPAKGSLVEVIVATQERTPEPPSSWNQRVDPALDRICLECLRKAPLERTPTARALALKLEAYLRDGPPRRRSKLAPLLGFGALFLLIGAGVYAAWRSLAPDRSEPRVPGVSDPAPHGLDEGALRALYDQGRFDEILAALEPHALDPQVPGVQRLILARAYGRLGRFADTLRVTEALVEQTPRNAAVWNVYGTSLWGLKRFEAALDAFDHGLDLNPDRETLAALLSNRAMIRLEMNGDMLLSLDDWERGLALKRPDEIEAKDLFNLGVLHGVLEHHEEAVAAYDRCLELDPRYPEAYYNRALSLSDLRRYSEAVDSLRELLQIDASFPQVHERLGWALLRSAQEAPGPDVAARLREALEQFDLHLSREPDHVDALFWRGVCHGRLGNFDAGEADFLRALELCGPGDHPTAVRRELEALRVARADAGR